MASGCARPTILCHLVTISSHVSGCLAAVAWRASCGVIRGLLSPMKLDHCAQAGQWPSTATCCWLGRGTQALRPTCAPDGPTPPSPRPWVACSSICFPLPVQCLVPPCGMTALFSFPFAVSFGLVLFRSVGGPLLWRCAGYGCRHSRPAGRGFEAIFQHLVVVHM